MEHRGVRYTIRAGIERDSWSVAIYPGGVDENPIRPNRTFANDGADTKPTPRVMQDSALGFWQTFAFEYATGDVAGFLQALSTNHAPTSPKKAPGANSRQAEPS
jgi:hypothetical protein